MMLKKILIILFILIFNLPVSAEDKIHVAFCIDNNYPLYTMLAINSILLNNTSNSKYYFHIVENNVSKFHKFQMKHFIKNRGAEIEFIPFNTQVIDEGKNVFTVKNSRSQHITRIGIARIMLPELLLNLDKILYLDADILVTTDLKNLWDMELEQYYAGMVEDSIINYSFDGEYYNSGVILINATRWRNDRISEKLINYIQTENYNFPDQDAINKILKNKIKKFDFNWNFQFPASYSSKYDNQRPYPKNCIYHYYTDSKPWKFIFSKDNFTKLYLDYWNKSYLVIYKPLHLLIRIEDLKKQIAMFFFNEFYIFYKNKI